ncbi:arylsulfatase A-like enzyme [Roseimicrobium gellanilyticum]|uniref:Arylsulfatase A-like enzyme n=2 Tax=Roseimicrobium gellanilyticum TaxID=748857 RepID=A0A366HEH9_9BACT|nr:arylsulfatase A-like enzyme [Roseimicrobium gellanilyticum]
MAVLPGVVRAAERPNILWLTSEDNSPYLGCYGDKLAKTPHLDKLATEGVRYRNAFANSPVCSAARTTLITGMNGCALGVQHHRSKVAIPEGFQLYPEVLRAAGYYCTNNSKTDYNLTDRQGIWDESSKNAHYKNRAQGQPFFAVFNFTTTHESQVAPKEGKTDFRIPPEQMPLPPYHPDTPEIRRDWANYYDQMTLMDEQVGQMLDQLENAGLAEDTIVFHYSDHGGALPGGKRHLHDSGTRVPMIVRIPEKWKQWRPAQPGEWVEDPVSFVDLPATVFSLCGVEKPANYQGRAFLGEKKETPREYVFLYRGRMDARYDNSRAIRDKQYLYIKNYSPHRPWGQYYEYAFEQQPSMRSWYAEYLAGRCNEVQSAYWKLKASEELYEIGNDPFQNKNLIDDPAQKELVAAMRKKLLEEMLSVRDTGFIPEGMYEKLASKRTIFDFAQNKDAYPLAEIISVADFAIAQNPPRVQPLIKSMYTDQPLMRYWGTVGCLVLQKDAMPAKSALIARLKDEWNDVRIVAAEALGWLGESDAAANALAEVIRNGSRYEVVAALNALDAMRAAGHVPLARAQEMVRGVKFAEPANRVADYLLSLEK